MSKKVVVEILKWTFDLAFLGALIWYFSTPGMTEQFWSTGASAFCGGLETVCRLLPRQVNNTQVSKSPPPPLFVPPPLPTAEQLATEVPGDCFPPEIRDEKEAAATAHLLYTPPPLPVGVKVRSGHGKPIEMVKKKVDGIPLYLVTINLNDPETYITIALPKNAQEANSSTYTAGHESFDSFVKRCPAAVLMNGTFFSKDEQERVMGNMVSAGKFLKYSQWENYGTTLGLRKGDRPEMITARAEGKPQWDEQWFSITCGPRLVKQGEIWLNPELEGFSDPHVLGAGSRCAIGFSKSGKQLYLVNFLRGLSLKEEAKLMRSIGCYEAMNLDGGASKALAQNGSFVMKPGRGLTNVLVVYDCKHKAPGALTSAWENFQIETTKAEAL